MECRHHFPRVKAIRFCEYGPPDVLRLEDIEKPVPNDNEVLVKVWAASLNAAEALRYLDQGHARGKVVITVE